MPGIVWPHVISAVLLAGKSDSSACAYVPVGGGYAEIDCAGCTIEVRAHPEPFQDSTNTFVVTTTKGAGLVKVWLPWAPYVSVKVTNTSGKKAAVNADFHMFEDR